MLHVERSSAIAGYELRMACYTYTVKKLKKQLRQLATQNCCLHVDRSAEVADFELRFACYTQKGDKR